MPLEGAVSALGKLAKTWRAPHLALDTATDAARSGALHSGSPSDKVFHVVLFKLSDQSWAGHPPRVMAEMRLPSIGELRRLCRAAAVWPAHHGCSTTDQELLALTLLA